MSELIDRQAALNALMDAVKSVGVLDADDIKTVFDALPNVQHEKTQLFKEDATSDQPVVTDTNVGSCSEFPNSSDAINRQDAIDALDKRFDNIPMEQTAEILKLRKDLRELPTIQPEPQWIPVEKELPEPRIDVWVNSDLGQMVGYYDEMVNLWYGRDYLELIVNAWMPLPEAYKPNK